MSLPALLDKLDRSVTDKASIDGDYPWRRILEQSLPSDLTLVSSVSICELLGIKPTTFNNQRVARIMRSLGYLPHRSRKVRPGGFRTTAARGWVRSKPIE